MILHEMLANTSYYGQVLIYARNAYDQCVEIFQGSVENARKDEYVWDYLTYEVDQWICGNHWTSSTMLMKIDWKLVIMIQTGGQEKIALTKVRMRSKKN